MIAREHQTWNGKSCRTGDGGWLALFKTENPKRTLENRTCSTSPIRMRMASCRSESQSYRNCLKEARVTGKKCTRLAQTLEACREKWRAANQIEHSFDGTRVLPNPKCKGLNIKVQSCIKIHKGDQSNCSEQIASLDSCMKKEPGIVAAPTEGDKVWSDYKGNKN